MNWPLVCAHNMLFRREDPVIETARLLLRVPHRRDYRGWFKVQQTSRAFLDPWEPVRPDSYFSQPAYRNFARSAQLAARDGIALPLFLFDRDGQTLLGGINLNNIRRGPSQMATIGYWMGASYARQGYMREALVALIAYAFDDLGLSRLEAGCLPENGPSRALLESCGFVHEGAAKNYLQINGRWRDHVLYAHLRADRCA